MIEDGQGVGLSAFTPAAKGSLSFTMCTGMSAFRLMASTPRFITQATFMLAPPPGSLGGSAERVSPSDTCTGPQHFALYNRINLACCPHLQVLDEILHLAARLYDA